MKRNTDSIIIKFVHIALLLSLLAFGLLSSAKVAVSATVFSYAELAGTWYFHGYSDDTVSNSPDWTQGTIDVDAFGDISGGTITKGNGTSATVISAGSSLRIDASGLLAGEVVADFSGVTKTMRILLGRLDANQTLGTMVGNDFDTGIFGPPFMGTMIKAGGTFTATELAGTWYFNSLGDDPLSNNPDWTAGTLVVDALGNVTGGSLQEGDGLTATVTGGTLNVDANGVVTGSVTSDFGFITTTTTITHGKLDINQTKGAVVGSDDQGHRIIGTMAKAGGAFTPNDLAGTWFLQSFADAPAPASNDPGWSSGTLIVDSSGNITAGAIRYSGASILTLVNVVPGSSLSVGADGVVSGSVITTVGTITIPLGKLDIGKTVGSFVGYDNGHRLIGTMVKASATPGLPMAWGNNASYQIGDGTSLDKPLPVPVSGLTVVVDIAGGRHHSLAVKSDGSAWAWGHNFFGQLGDGTTTDRVTAIQVTGLSDVTHVAGGRFHSLAIKSDGTVWAWGDGTQGQLGNGTTTSSLTPVQVIGLTGVVAIEAGEFHSLALRVDGTVWAWGRNVEGQLGDGTNNDSSTPVQVTGLSNVRIIAAGNSHNLANTWDGRVWAWGNNSEGQLGNGTTTASSTPVHVLSDAGILAAGGAHSLAVTSDGTIWSWGRNVEGQLGNGTFTNQLSPVHVSTLMYAVAMVAGESHSMAVIVDGSVWAWGDNSEGQLGDGTTINRPTPVLANGLTGVIAIAAGGTHSQVIIGDRDGDGIVDPIDGEYVGGVFVDHSKVYSNNFTDQHLGGTSFGLITDRSDLTISVLDDISPAAAGVWLAAHDGTGTATVNTCGFDVFLTAGDSTRITCSSLTAQVLAGPIEIQLAPDILVSAPAGVTVTLTELAPGQFEVKNAADSQASVTIAQQGETTEVAPGDTLVTGDTTPPVVTAAFIPLDKVKEDKGRFRIEYSCIDDIDPNPIITAAELNGIPVSNAQVVKLKVDDKTKVKFKHGVLKLKAPSFSLVVDCTDAAGNTATATAAPQFASGDDDDHEDDDDDEVKHKAKKPKNKHWKYRDKD